MQLRPAFPLLFRSLLYWALVALATGTSHAQDPVRDATPPAQARVAVILPLQSASFGRHAESVRLGILAAAGLDPDRGPKVEIFATGEDPGDIVAAYQRAVSLGARAVIGPLTRDGVTSLAYSGVVSVPTLALNMPEGDIILPRDLYVFGLQIEAEARQTAQLAFRQGSRRIFLIEGETALGGRITQAFAEEWIGLKGEIAGQFSYTTEIAQLGKLRDQLAASRADSIFLALDATRARFVRSYLGGSLPVFATSQVFTTNSDTLANYDLEGVRFLDMPWLLQPDHPAVISYLRTDTRGAPLDQERFYALGIDAYRIIQILMRPFQAPDALDGVTGSISQGNNQQFSRTLVPAQFLQGLAKPLDSAGR